MHVFCIYRLLGNESADANTNHYAHGFSVSVDLHVMLLDEENSYVVVYERYDSPINAIV